jgi:hypothetical protein
MTPVSPELFPTYLKTKVPVNIAKERAQLTNGGLGVNLSIKGVA